MLPPSLVKPLKCQHPRSPEICALLTLGELRDKVVGDFLQLLGVNGEELLEALDFFEKVSGHVGHRSYMSVSEEVLLKRQLGRTLSGWRLPADHVGESSVLHRLMFGVGGRL